MLPEEFCEKYKINLDLKEKCLCQKAINEMKSAVDKIHDETHIHRILDCLDEFLQTKEFLKYEDNIDLKVLYISILWHDVWKAKRDPANGLIYLFEMFWDGMGSYLNFIKEAKKAKLDRNLTKKIQYIIRKHSAVQFLPFKNLESKIITALDVLDMIDFSRLKIVEDKYLNHREIRGTTLNLAKIGMIFCVERRASKNLFLEFFNEKLTRDNKIFVKRAWREIKEYEIMWNLKKNGKKKEFEAYREKLKKELGF